MKKIILIGIMLLGVNGDNYGQLSQKPVNAKYIGQDFCIIDSTAYTWYKYGNKSGIQPYRAIYFDRKRVKYYIVTNMAKTNNIYYTYDTNKQEKVFAGKEREFAENSNRLLYVGNISDLERVYIDTHDYKKQYVKRLIPLKLDVYDALDPKDRYGRRLEKQKLKDKKLYPVMMPWLDYKRENGKAYYITNGMTVGYTNKAGQRFDLLYGGLLSEKKPVMSVEDWWARNPVNAKYIGQDLCVVKSLMYTWLAYNKQSGTGTYGAIYFDRKKVKSYSVTNIAETNDIYYTYDANKQEKVLLPHIREDEEQLLYVGNISELERVYIDTNDNKQYVKTLIPIKDEYTQFLDGILPVKGEFYPAMDERYAIIFTNKNYPGQKFTRSYTAEEGEYGESYEPGMLRKWEFVDP